MKSEIIEQPCLVLVGPTAIGKTTLSLTLARRFNCEIVSVDSMQLYKNMDIGTAKASLKEQAEIPHHMIDIINPDEDYDAARFARDGLLAIRDILSRGKTPLLTGGTGLYLRALTEGIFPGAPVDDEVRKKLNEKLAKQGCSKLHEELMVCDRPTGERVHPHDTQRLLRALEIFYITGIPWSEHLNVHKEKNQSVLFKNILHLGLTTDRKRLYRRIDQRCAAMLEAGLEAEVRTLLALGYAPHLKSLGSIGYRHMINYINGNWSKEEMIRLLCRDTRRYAKRQYTWFSKLTDLHWFDVEEREKILQYISNWINQNNPL